MNIKGPSILAAGYISLLLLITPLYYWSITRIDHCASYSQHIQNELNSIPGVHGQVHMFGRTGVIQ